ncbi:hypothetical protein JFV29_07615 [Peribacillus sp. TH16]|nr:hypothetical protein [Peribacillus sp. TH16]MBK5481804.1 hypothetical protein [Peribacillus sp. TH16]
MIKKIQVLDSNYGQQLFMLQKKAYQIEAEETLLNHLGKNYPFLPVK